MESQVKLDHKASVIYRNFHILIARKQSCPKSHFSKSSPELKEIYSAYKESF